MEKRLLKCFEKLYGKSAEVSCFAPGRINLIGEHTDYNGGYVFPCAIHLGIFCVASKRDDNKFCFYSENFSEFGVKEYSLDFFEKQNCFADYPASVTRVFLKSGYDIPCGANFYFSGNLPDGAGLSSSAAIETVTGVTLKELYSLTVSQKEIALLGQKAENRYIGVNCGIMDQFASAFGKEDCAILLNTQDLSYSYAPIKDVAMIIVDSKVKHSLASSAYNDRRMECERAAKELNTPLLCNLTPKDFEERKHLLTDEILIKRAHHVIYENQRVIDAMDALNHNDFEKLGELLNQSHKSLRDDYEVSCKELDFLADLSQNLSYIYGARMMGGGFGGCTINLVKNQSIDEFYMKMRSEYQKEFGILPNIYYLTASDGARKID